ncbi:MAG TPA: 16S rRNA processing protein RimM [Firmicutes bacterium]|nr:16S rRNA processing protein RimM [Bacillota bacterium]
MASELVTIGKIIAPFGIRGEAKVYPYSDFLERCYLLEEVFLEGKEISGVRAVKKAFIHKNLWVLHLGGSETRDDAAALVGSAVKIPASKRVKLPKGTYYFDQIIGLEVLTIDGEKLGTVGEILRTGGNDVYVINSDKKLPDGKNAKQILVPALKTVVKEINLQIGYLKVELPPGLVD